MHSNLSLALNPFPWLTNHWNLFPGTSSRTNQSRTTSLEVSKKSPFGREKIPKAVPHSTLHFRFLLPWDALISGTGWEPAFAQGEIWPETNGISWKSRHPGFTILESWRASKNWKGFGNDQGVSLKYLFILPHPPFGHLLPRGRRFSFAFYKQWILQLRVNPSCRMTWGWGESGRRNQFIKICRYKRHE